MIEGKTPSGFKYKLDERALDDWRLVDSLAKINRNKGNLMGQFDAVSEICDLLLGDSKDSLMEHIQKKNDGFIPADIVEKELTDIIKSAKEIKNSQASPSS
ncbi:MAG: hypothetical protein K6E34_04580 [Lachnospiraceae bacterium]|nr:hypothetical protein [Lachnospiraceae bacterium]